MGYALALHLRAVDRHAANRERAITGEIETD